MVELYVKLFIIIWTSGMEIHGIHELEIIAIRQKKVWKKSRLEWGPIHLIWDGHVTISQTAW